MTQKTSEVIQKVKNFVYEIAPKQVNIYRNYRKLKKEVINLQQKSSGSKDLSMKVKAVTNSKLFRSEQKSSEIFCFLEYIKSIKPRFICEIGSSRGGTLFLFCQISQPNSHIYSIDIIYPIERRLIYRRFQKKNQKISCIQADSQKEKTVSILKKMLGDSSIDILFIDGDHSFDGVMSDFKMYSPLVRKGGIIAFHDIVPDYKMRYGITSNSKVGDVPLFWSQLKQQHLNYVEFIEDPTQDGMGIGVLNW